MTPIKTVICFCKHPEANMVKSRLSAELDPVSAAKIYQIILEYVLQNICGHEFKVALYCYPDTRHPFLSYCRDKYNVSLYNQDGSDLGSRMLNAINIHLGPKQPVILIGSDCLEINANYINDAFLAFDKGHEIVLGPTLDGGYALIGANQIDESILTGITWSTGSVLQQTREKIKNLGWTFTCMPLIRDIDTLSDYQYFSAHKKFRHLFSGINKERLSAC